VVRYQPGSLHVSVTDDGQGTGGDCGQDGGAGHGLAGMRERVLLYGGELQAGQLPGRGYQIVARLPVEYEPENGGDPAGQRPART
jgi:signal transduction histidine kinase